ncbi:unannotated protein [freshwater metagenome]|uniref:Unannotated protein n=1 Tax=freshwater metagenome TaxID=449393 RepID=A0A6J6JVD2_9ZZZZ
MGLGSPRWVFTESIIFWTKSLMRSGVSAKVIIGIKMSRFAISMSMFAASKSASTLLPSAPQLESMMTSFSGSMYSPSITSMPAATRVARPRSVASITGPISSSPWRSSKARAASIEARMRPDIDVVWVESNILLNLARSTYLSRTKTKDAWE